MSKLIELVNKKFTEFRELKNDWDGYGAAVPTEISMLSTITFLESYFNTDEIILPYVFPNPVGCIRLEWQVITNDKTNIELEVDFYSGSDIDIVFIRDTECVELKVNEYTLLKNYISKFIILKPCPFCGFEPDRNDMDCVYPVGKLRDIFNINCYETGGGCSTHVLGESPYDCVTKWQRRI